MYNTASDSPTPPVNAYYTNPRADILRHLPITARAVLDVGCGAGALGASIKRRQQASVIGVEYIQEQGERAGEILDTVYIGDVEQLELPYAPGSFDCLIYSDVLEHLTDPWGLIARHRPLLRDSGTLLVSLPNIQFIGILFMLLRGDWHYKERGVMDKTHLRFFTRRSALRMIEGAGYRVVRIQRNFRWFDKPDSSLHRYARVLAPIPWVRDLYTYQYIFVGRPVA